MNKKRDPLERLLEKVRVDPHSGCWMWQASRSSTGYGQFYYEGKLRRAHRVSYTLHKGAIPEGKFVCHHCDEPLCINPAHLFVGTPKDNTHDAIQKGRIDFVTLSKLGVDAAMGTPRGRKGEAHHKAKLTEAQVLCIREDPRTQKELAEAYGVSKGLVSMIKNRVIWKHLNPH